MRTPRAPRLDAIDPIVASAGAALLCTLLARHLTSGEAEVPSEALCWAILPILFGETIRFNSSTSTRTASSVSLWIVAAGVAVACCYTAEIGLIYLVPALTPLVLVAEKRLWPESGDSTRSRSRFSPFATTVWGTTLVAVLAIFALPGWSLRESVQSIVPLAALLVLYLAFLPRTKTLPRTRTLPRTAKETLNRFLPFVDIEEAIVPLSRRAVVFLVAVVCMQSVVFGLPSVDIAPTLLPLGLAKASSWYFTIKTARQTSWCVATAIVSFGFVASRDPFIQATEIGAFSPVIASFLVLGQIIYMLPKQARGRSALWILILASLGPYLANVVAIRVAQSSVPPSFGHSQDHPVEALIQNARTEFKDLLQRQSKTYEAASQEYRRRYRAEPPPGFEAWYEFAVANQSPIIDEFDSIYDSLSPFWNMKGEDVKHVMQKAVNTQGIDLWLCTLSGKTAAIGCTHPQRTFDRNIGDMFNKLLGDLGGVLPDVQFLVNHIDEPRVVIPPLSAQAGNIGLKVTYMAERPTWDAITKYCPAQQDIDNHDDNAVSTFGLPLITNRTSALDLCRNPEYSTMHGLFQSPTSFRLIQGPVPVLSPGAPSTMADILYPSPAYVVEPEFRYNPAHDPPWHQKHNNLYWAGSTTGAIASPSSQSSWRNFHRQRFVHLAQNLPGGPGPNKLHTYLRESPTTPGSITPMQSSFLNPRHFAVSFTRIFQCATWSLCRAQRFHFRTGAWSHGDAALQSKLVFDIDGNGISGRFYKLLASRSAVVKQTLFREWHDDRLVPWVHYVPVSMGMGELGEVVGWFLETEKGRERAREIGEWGADWFAKAMREVDVKIYLWRLVLELARLQDQGREALVN